MPGLINVFLRDVTGAPWLTFNIFSMSGLVLVTVLHTFPFVFLLASSALQSVDASYEEAAQILGAGKLRTALFVTLPLIAPAVLAGTLLAFVNAIALFGSQAILGLPGRIVTLPTRIYALFDYPPQYGLASALSLLFIVITVAALYLQHRFLARRSYVTVGGKGARLTAHRSRPPAMAAVRLLRAGVRGGDRSALRCADRGLALQVLGPELLARPDACQLPVRAVRIQRDPASHSQQPAARHCRRDHRGAAGRRDQLDRRAHQGARAAAARLRGAGAARASGHRHGGGADPVLAHHADRALRHADDPAARLCRPLHSARRACRQHVAAPDRSVA